MLPANKNLKLTGEIMSLYRVLSVAALLTVLAACNNSSNTPKSEATSSASSSLSQTAPPKKIALVMKTLTNPFFIEMEKGARRAEKEFGVELQVKTGSQETAIEQQIQIVDDLVQEKVDALVIAPSDSKRLVPILKKAQAAGIVVINLDNQLDGEVMRAQQMQPVPFVSVDNESASYQAAKFLADQTKTPTSAAILEGIRSTENAHARLIGAERAFSGNPNIRLVDHETADWQIDEAHDVTKRMFAQHPDIKILFCANDMMALGAVKYLQDSGRKDVLVAGYDALDEAKAAIKSGAMVASVDQQAAEQGYQGVALAVRGLKGEKLPGKVTVDAHLVTASTAN